MSIKCARYELTELKPGIEAAIHRLAAAAKFDGYPNIEVKVKEGKPQYVIYDDEDGYPHLLTYINGELYEHVLERSEDGGIDAD